MKIGFSGTRRGMTEAQILALRSLVSEHCVTEFHHGDCVGADEQAAKVVYIDFDECQVVKHPPRKGTSFQAMTMFDQIREPKPYFARNRNIVNESDLLIATPWQTERPAPKSGGGTWFTINYANQVGKPVIIIWPDGRVESSVPEARDAGRDGSA